MSNVQKFSDFAEDNAAVMDGEKVKLTNILEKEITVLNFKIAPSKYGKAGDECMTVQFLNEAKEKKIFFTGSSVLIEQMKKYGNKVPFLATVKRIDKYYTFS